MWPLPLGCFEWPGKNVTIVLPLPRIQEHLSFGTAAITVCKVRNFNRDRELNFDYQFSITVHKFSVSSLPHLPLGLKSSDFLKFNFFCEFQSVTNRALNFYGQRPKFSNSSSRKETSALLLLFKQKEERPVKRRALEATATVRI